MTTRKIVMAGFGGQGIMAMGQLVSYAGMLEDKHVSWFPSYGPEMRGGAANCSVVVSSEPVGSPIIAIADDIIVMNEPSLLQFESNVKEGGNLFINSSLVVSEPTRTDINIYKIPVNDIAIDLGNAKVANMVMLGAYLNVTNLVNVETVIKAFTKVYGDAKKKLLPINEKALQRGGEAINGEQQQFVGGAAPQNISRTPGANMDLQGGSEIPQANYMKDIKKMDKEEEEKVFSSEINMVKQALLNEIEGINYYKISALQFKGSNSEKIFESLAHQSQEHVDYLNKLKDQIEKNEANIIEKIKSAVEVDDMNWDKVNPAQAAMAISVFNIGMNIKRNNIEFYEKAAEKSNFEPAKGLYKELAYWENFQLQQLKGQYDVYKSEWWSDQSFAPF